MKKRVLGRTGIEVTELALGGLFVSSYGGEYDQAKLAIDRALELGVNYIDTAPGYGNSEEVLGKALADHKGKEIIISTKLGGRPTPFDPRNPEGLRQSVETSLILLGRTHIDILMIHEPDRPGQYDWFPDWNTFDAPATEVINQLQKQGKVRYSGLGGTTAYEMGRVMRSNKFDVVLTAFNYSLLWREAELEVLPAAKKLKMGVVIGSPLQQGSLAKRQDEGVKNSKWLSEKRRAQFLALYALLDEIQMSISDLGIRFVISNPDISAVLMGARSKAEVDANAAAVAKGPLSADVLKKLNAIAAMVPFRPYEEPFWMPLAGDHRGPGRVH